MNEQKGTDVLDKDVQLHFYTCIYPPLMTSVKSVVNGYNNKPYVRMMRPVDSEIWKRETNARTCRRIPFVACINAYFPGVVFVCGFMMCDSVFWQLQYFDF